MFWANLNRFERFKIEGEDTRPYGPFIYYVSTGLGGWLGSEIGHFCLQTVNKEWVGGLENTQNQDISFTHSSAQVEVKLVEMMRYFLHFHSNCNEEDEGKSSRQVVCSHNVVK